jgi:hypothetical protein
MPPEYPRRNRVITDSNRAAVFAELVEDIVRPKPKLPKKGSTKNSRPVPPTVPAVQAESGADSDNETPQAAPTSSKRQTAVRPPVNTDECKYKLACITAFDNKKLWPDGGVYRLGEFKVHEYNAKACIEVTKEATKGKTGLEFGSAVATISGYRMKQFHQIIEDPEDWKRLETTLEEFMKERVTALRVDYVVTYDKKRLMPANLRSIVPIDDSDLDVEELDPSKKRKVYILFILQSNISLQLLTLK